MMITEQPTPIANTSQVWSQSSHCQLFCVPLILIQLDNRSSVTHILHSTWQVSTFQLTPQPTRKRINSDHFGKHGYFPGAFFGLFPPSDVYHGDGRWESSCQVTSSYSPNFSRACCHVSDHIKHPTSVVASTMALLQMLLLEMGN